VIYSAWFAASTLTWADSAHATYGTISRGNRAAPAVTAAVIDNGVVLSYYRSAATSNTQLPYIYPAGGMIQQVSSFMQAGTITYFVADLSDTNASGVVPGGDFRYVVIPGSVSGGRMANGAASGYTVEQLKAMSYEQLTALFNIPATGSNN
jgi:hypothetical protein